MSASLGPGCGTLTSSHCRTSGPPVLWIRIACAMAMPLVGFRGYCTDSRSLALLGQHPRMAYLTARAVDLPALRTRLGARPDLLVIGLCAAWCGTGGEFAPAFARLAAEHPS